jgi:serine/threonine protein kinase
MRNLHPGNIFISNENSNDVLITDAGLCQLRGVNRFQLSLHIDFVAPEIHRELQGNFGISTPQSDDELAYVEDPEAASIWSIGMIVKFLATGNVSVNLRHLTGKASPYSSELVDFIVRTLQETPGRRISASKLLSHPFIAKRGQHTSDCSAVLVENERARVKDKLD